MVGNRFGGGPTLSAISLLLSSLFKEKGASKLCPHGREPPLAWTGQRPSLCPWWRGLDAADTPTTLTVSGVGITTRAQLC